MAKEKTAKVKKPIFKRWWFWVIIVVIVIGIIGGSGSKEASQPTSTPVTTEAPTPAETSALEEDQTSESMEASSSDEPNTPQGIIEQVIRNRIGEEYTYSEIDRITINDNLGTDATDDYIALVYITWNQKNSGKTSKEVLKLYSDDLAATIGEQCENVQELAIFWTVPYLNNANAKCAYERKGNGMYEMDMMWDTAFSG